MITQYKIQKDVGGYNNFGLQVSNTKYSATLAAATDTTLTVPSASAMGVPVGQKSHILALVTVEYGEEVWFALNATAAAPVGGTFAATNSEQIVGGQDFAREVVGGDVLHFFNTSGNVDVSVVFYALPAS